MFHASSRQQNDFIPSAKFAGAKPGFLFRKNKEGLGYYRDRNSASNININSNNGSSKRSRSSVTDDISSNKCTDPNPKDNESIFDFAEKNPPVKKIVTLSIAGMKSCALSLEKAINENMSLRAKYPDDPAKFMESELTLHDEISSVKSIATSSELYPLLVSLGTYVSLLGLITHENSDVSVCAVSVLRELIDVDVITENFNSTNKSALSLPLAIIEEGGLEILTVNLHRLVESEPEDATGITDTITLIETLLELDATIPSFSSEKSIAELIFSTTTFVGWCLDRVADSTSRPFSSIKLQSSEVLSTLFGHEDIRTSKTHVLSSVSCHPSIATSAKIDGTENLLQTVGKFRKKDPQMEEEVEFLENIFDVLCFCLVSSVQGENSNITAFLDGQGVELCLRCMKEKVHAGHGGMKLLGVALGGAGGRRVAEVFVSGGGLKTIFPIFMGRSVAMPKPAGCSSAGSDLAKSSIAASTASAKLSKRAKSAVKDRREFFSLIETYSIDILYSLTKHLTPSSPKDALVRVVAKFADGVETNESERCDRLVELVIKKDMQARTSELKYLRSEEADLDEQDGGEDLVELAALNKKLEGGGESFHKVGAIAGFLCVESKKCHEQFRNQLKVNRNGMTIVKDALREFAGLLSDGLEKQRLLKINEKI